MRLAVRDQIINVLSTLPGFSQPRAGAADDLEQQTLPAIDVRLGSGSREPSHMDGGQRYSQRIDVRVVAHGQGDLDQILSDSVDAIESALEDIDIAGVLSIELTDIDFELSEDRPRGEAVLAYLVDYVKQ